MVDGLGHYGVPRRAEARRTAEGVAMSEDGKIDQQALWQEQAKTQIALLEAIQEQIGRSASASR